MVAVVMVVAALLVGAAVAVRSFVRVYNAGVAHNEALRRAERVQRIYGGSVGQVQRRSGQVAGRGARHERAVTGGWSRRWDSRPSQPRRRGR